MVHRKYIHLKCYVTKYEVPLGLRGTRPLVLIEITGGSKTSSSKD
jgi:hypothetical protein